MVAGVQDRLDEEGFARCHPELSAEAALIIWVLASEYSVIQFPDIPDQADDPKPH